MSWARFVVLASVPPFAGIGAGFLVAPAFMASLVGLELTNVTADNDVRAVYGGLSLGCAAFLLWCGLRPGQLAAGVHAQVFTFAGLVAGRTLSVALRGAPDALGVALHAAEIAGLACGLVALAQVRRAMAASRSPAGASAS